MISSLRSVATLPLDVANMIASPDAFDATVCLLAAADFLRGKVIPVTDRELTEEEKLRNWVRSPTGD